MKPYFVDNSIQLYYLDIDPFMFSFTPIKGLFEGLKLFKEQLDLSELDPSQKHYSKDKEKRIRKNGTWSSPRNIFRWSSIFAE